MQRADTGAKEKAKQKVRNRLLNNLGLKLTSVIIAIILWFIVAMVYNPKDSVSFSNIQVNLINTDLLEKGNKVYEILDNSDVVRVTVQAPRNVINQLRASDIVATADVSKLTEVNTIAINYEVLNEDVEILDITGNHDVVQLNVEERARKWINVQCNIVGEVAEGYMVANTSSDQTRIEVVGPKSVVERISYAGLDIDVTGATSNLSANVDIQLYDAEKNLVDPSHIEKNAENMRVEVQVLATKEVPFELKASGIPAEGYLATGEVKLDPEKVLLAGTVSTLSNVSKIVIPETELDITDAESDVVNEINIKKYLPDYVVLADGSFNGRVTATAYVEPRVEKTLLVPAANITVLNTPEGYEYEFADNETCRMRISGLDADVSEVDPNTVRGTVNIGEWMERNSIRELTAGTHEVPVSFQLSDQVSIDNVTTVRIYIVEVEDE
ncbi:CdaR family protein [Acetatifactor muris]|uniref:CdaR family protein n=1 Tax=Acetatifactor muris TaxID=879566 RepID=UPI001558D6C1|nr:CdaR family protein [Acetatifactor muris]MCI8798874.1 YbbR-like domain-containing protein [Lachnospiraceae bacterium]MCR2049187.1 CdaR family protein [Acetatifactor muris]